jgi:tetratricopeptide (TPR) repeat protein
VPPGPFSRSRRALPTSTASRARIGIAAVALSIVGSAGQATSARPAPVTADHPRAAAAALRAEGLALGYNLDHAEAVAVFKQAIAEDPLDPAGYRLLAAGVWISLLFQQGAITVDDYLGQARAQVVRSTPAAGLAATFHDALAQALKRSEARLRARPADADAHYQMGAAYGFLASYTATVEGRVLGSFGSARRAYREHARALALAPERKDAGLIVGMYRYAVSEMSAPLRLAAWLAGMGSDRARGLRMVEAAARYPSDAQPNALFTLVLLYNREARYDDALRVIGELERRYPRNRLLWLEAGVTALRAGRPVEARASLEQGLARLARDGRSRAPGEDARWRLAYGATLVALKDTGPAERELRAALEGATRDWVRGRVHKELGKLADLADDRPRALDEYRLADRLCRRDGDSACADDVSGLIRNAKRKRTN